MRPQEVETHLVTPTASSARYTSAQRGNALTLQQLLHTAVGCLLKTLHCHRRRLLALHTLLIAKAHTSPGIELP